MKDKKVKFTAVNIDPNVTEQTLAAKKEAKSNTQFVSKVR
jgi:hypothetical protein